MATISCTVNLLIQLKGVGSFAPGKHLLLAQVDSTLGIPRKLICPSMNGSSEARTAVKPSSNGSAGLHHWSPCFKSQDPKEAE